MPEEVYAPIIDDTFTLKDALTEILKISSANDALKCGIRQSTKALLRKSAKLVLLSDDIDEKYKTILVGLSKKYGVPVVKIAATDLVEMSCLGRVTLNDVRKMPRCSAVAITDFLRKSIGRSYLEQMISKGNVSEVK